MDKAGWDSFRRGSQDFAEWARQVAGRSASGCWKDLQGHLCLQHQPDAIASSSMKWTGWAFTTATGSPGTRFQGAGGGWLGFLSSEIPVLRQDRRTHLRGRRTQEAGAPRGKRARVIRAASIFFKNRFKHLALPRAWTTASGAHGAIPTQKPVELIEASRAQRSVMQGAGLLPGQRDDGAWCMRWQPTRQALTRVQAWRLHVRVDDTEVPAP